jgi:hypothetical protein
VHTYLGGPRSRAELKRDLPPAPERWPGSFVVDLDGEMIGQVERFDAWGAEQWLGLCSSPR